MGHSLCAKAATFSVLDESSTKGHSLRVKSAAVLFQLSLEGRLFNLHLQGHSNMCDCSSAYAYKNAKRSCGPSSLCVPTRAAVSILLEAGCVQPGTRVQLFGICIAV